MEVTITKPSEVKLKFPLLAKTPQSEIEKFGRRIWVLFSSPKQGIVLKRDIVDPALSDQYIPNGGFKPLPYFEPDFVSCTRKDMWEILPEGTTITLKV